MNNSLPLSQLVISAVIPAGESHAVIDIDKKSFPDDIDLTINSVVVKIDTTSLYNVKTTNTVVARNDSGPKNIVVEAGYYDQESLEEMFGSYLTFTEDGYVHPSGPAYDLVFQQAPDLRRILGFDEIQASGVKGREPVDVSNGLNCIRIYSNLVKQMISFETSPLVDCMIYSTMGLNNVCSFSHLNMPGVRMSDLRSFQFDVRDRHGEVVSIASDIYINIRLSVNGKV